MIFMEAILSESKLQAKAIKKLQIAGWYVIRIIAASKAGVLDLVCCTPKGLFVAIEIKFGKNKISKLQNYNIDQIKAKKGAAYVIWNIEELEQIITLYQ